MTSLLIVRLSALGDIVHALPVLAALRRALPETAVDWLVEEQYAAILDLAAGIRTRIVVRATADDVSPGRVAFGGAIGYLRAVRYLRAQGYEAALDLQGLLKSAGWARLSGARRVIGFDRAHLREALAAAFYTEMVVPGEAAHVIDKNLSLLSALDIGDRMRSWPLGVEGSPAITAAIAAAGGARRYIVLNPGAAWPNKRWPAERFGALAAALKAHTGLTSLITWGPSERALADAVVAASSGAAAPAPPTPVNDLAALLGQAALVVSGDTGPLHIAAAMGAPLVGLYGPTWPERNGPWDPRDVVISRADGCVCHHKRQCLRGAPCINEIDVDAVVRAALARLESR